MYFMRGRTRRTKPLEAKKEWEIKGFLCEPCLKEKERVDNELKQNCVLCNAKLGFIKHRSKKEWNLKGYLCKNCWENH